MNSNEEWCQPPHNCLSGTWSLLAEESDDVQGLEKDRHNPLAVMLTNSEDSWFSITQQASPGDIEEVILSCRSTRTETRAYQIGKLNYECVGSVITAPRCGGKRLILAFASVDAAFHKLHIVRLGPHLGHRSEEKYTLMTGGQLVTSTVSMRTSTDSQTVTLKRVFRRCHGTPAPWPISFKSVPRSLGWAVTAWKRGPRCAIKSVEITFLPSISILTPSDSVPLGGSYYARSPQDINSSLEDSLTTTRHLVTKRFGEKISNGEQVTIYRIQCKRGSESWVTAHRYREFYALKLFIEQEANGKLATLNPPLVLSDPFPSRTLSHKALSAVAGKKRMGGLASFTRTVLKWVCDGGGGDTMADVMYAFLEVPEVTTAPLAAAAPSAVTVVPVEAEVTTVGRLSGLSHIVSSMFKGRTSDLSGEDYSYQPKTLSDSYMTSQSMRQLLEAIEKEENEPSAVRPALLSQVSNRMAPPVHAGASDGTVSNMRSPEDLSNSKKAVNDMLEHGLLVVKHGRSGAGKKRLLLCNRSVSRLYWISPPSNTNRSLLNVFKDTPGQLQENKSISLTNVKAIRRGVDSDPLALGKLGSSNLRRSCPSAAWPRCLCLVTDERSWDIECMASEQFDGLYAHLQVLCTSYRAPAST